jgi:hypothetical protein
MKRLRSGEVLSREILSAENISYEEDGEEIEFRRPVRLSVEED